MTKSSVEADISRPRIEVLIDEERKFLQRRCYALENALQALLDEQKGPPLLRDAERWERAVVRAQKLLREPTCTE